MDWKDIVRTVAPWLGSALGGPLGGAAMTAIASALGLSESTEAALKSAISGVTPEQMAAMKKADQEFSVKMQELGFANMEAMEALYVKDMDSARNRQVQVKDNVNTVLAYTIVGSFITVIAATLLGFAEVDSALAGTLVGYLSAKSEMICSFYFGSSKGSDRKTELLAQAGVANGK
jgi:hypothetical protein